MFSEPQQTQSGLFIVGWKANYPHFVAWVEWRRDALGRVFIPETMTTPIAWPPATGDELQIVLEHLESAHKSIRGEKTGSRVELAPIPKFPPLWHEWSPSKKRDVAEREMTRRLQDPGWNFSDWKAGYARWSTAKQREAAE